MNICWHFTHPQAIRDVDEFVSSSEQIWESEKLLVCKTQIHHEDVFNFKPLLPAKIQSIHTDKNDFVVK